MKRTSCYLLVFSTFLFTCCNHHVNEKSYPMNSVTKTLSQLKQQVIETGDTCAYSELKQQLWGFTYGSEELLSFALIMANKYNLPQAYFDVFDCLTASFLPDINQIDSRTAQLSIEYLLLAARKGQIQASEIVKTYSITDNCKDDVAQICRIYQ